MLLTSKIQYVCLLLTMLKNLAMHRLYLFKVFSNLIVHYLNTDYNCNT